MLSPTGLMWTRIAAGIFAFLAVNAGYGIWLQRKKARGGQNWPVVQGEIVASETSAAPTHISDDESDYAVDIRYRYKVGAKDYEGHRIRFGSPSHVDSMLAQELTGRYPMGACVRVYYNPQRPSEAVLEPTDASGIAALVALCLVMTTITGVLVAHAVAGEVLTTDAGVPLFAFLMPLAATAFGLAAIGSYWKLRQARSASQRWPMTQGRITSSDVVTEVEQNSDDKGRQRMTKRFRVALQFAYRVGGREYYSSHWNWGWTALHGDRSKAEAVAAKYPSGSEVPVYYDPAEPTTAVLDPTNRSGVAAPLWVGIFLILASAVFFWGLTHLQMAS
jgi:Protein of unknown function (DUF3592)